MLYNTSRLMLAITSILACILVVSLNSSWAETSSEPKGILYWKFETSSPIRSTPAISHGMVFFGAGSCWSGKYNHALYALDTHSGDIKWAYELDSGGYGDPDFVVYHTPIVAEDLLYFDTGIHTVYAVDLNSGQVRTRISLDDRDRIKSPCNLIDNNLYISSYDILYSVSPTSGDIIWKFETSGRHNKNGIPYSDEIISKPLKADSLIIFQTYHGVYAIDQSKGQKRWFFEMTGFDQFASLSIIDDIILAKSNRHLYALDTTTGKQLWLYENTGGRISSPATARGNVFVVTADSLHAINLRDGKEDWGLRHGIAANRDHNSPTVANNTIYVGGGFYSNNPGGIISYGNVVAIDLLRKETKWKFDVESPIMTEIAVCDNIVFFGTLSGYLYALR